MIKRLESTKLGIEFVYLIAVIFGMNYGCKMFDDHFKIIWGVMDVYINWAQPRGSCLCMSKPDFWIKCVYLD